MKIGVPQDDWRFAVVPGQLVGLDYQKANDRYPRLRALMVREVDDRNIWAEDAAKVSRNDPRPPIQRFLWERVTAIHFSVHMEE